MEREQILRGGAARGGEISTGTQGEDGARIKSSAARRKLMQGQMEDDQPTSPHGYPYSTAAFPPAILLPLLQRHRT
jgi:hypothetical protein